ncbi:E3 ubiquitin-protein ligase HOS1 isoform X1 [Ricinus communis]|uniref:E3 ubiquitin-protein ligase HOS1 isoform X1 n=1 Tax=Ricinus communis TaxID=3988 RepID=UPI00201A3993|nr:E3 ubiquitin-protein ligase HOS1 isoform X1 [Ricinus communis]
MERNAVNGRISPSTSADRGKTSRSTTMHIQPNYTSRAVQEALEHLASIDLIELCSEAKVERCRAIRDLRSCGRYVQSVLVSCGHASLCSECSQRCDLCPICRVPIPKNSNRLRLRLYYECIEAGLISKKYDERFQEKDDGDNQLTADVQRLYSLFDVSMENNLVSLICHYVTDVCMDETAVSSDPVVAFLLDEVVVKDWCKQTFRNIVLELQGIYNLEAEEMKTRLNFLVKFSVRLAGLSDVLEVLESSFKGNLSARLHDLQLLQESILKTKQHMEIMKWCIKHQFLENIKSRHANFSSWRSIVRERKSAAITRSWPDIINQSADSSMQTGSLFIEDALSNLGIEQGYLQDIREDLELASLQKDRGSFFRSKIEGVAGCYPFESLRAAVDVLFLHGSSDLVVAKQAILLYFLFDRYWTMPDETWRHLIDDFAATFGITRHALLESLAFYLLDDHTDETLKEACHLLPEIGGPTTHPKIAQVLLEREAPEVALMVLRWSGRDGSQMVSLSEAVTAIRVRVECGLLTEAFMHQRMLCTKVKEKKRKDGLPEDASAELKGDCKTWEDWVEVLVTEICCLCIKSKLVDRMIELPWSSDEENYIHKCLLECATHDPSSTTGSLLVVFYLQRYRYAEAYQVDLQLQNVEQDFLSKNSDNEEVLSRMRSASNWRTGLVAKSIELLPQAQQPQAKTGKLLPQIYNVWREQVEIPAKSEPMVQQLKSSSLLIPPSDNSSLLLQTNHITPFKSSVTETSIRSGSVNKPHFGLGDNGPPSVLHERLFTNAGKGLKPQVNTHKSVNYDGTPNHVIPCVSPMSATRLKDVSKTSFNVLSDSHLHHGQLDEFSPEMEQNGFSEQFQNTSLHYVHKVKTPIAMSGGSRGFLNDSSRSSTKRVHSYRPDDGSWNVTSEADPMDIGISSREKGFTVDEGNVNGGLRWRSDESSDEEGEHNLERAVGVASFTTPGRGIRRSRFAKR